jgi:hypothetical protein
VNLGLFTVELERHGAGDQRLSERQAPASRPRQRPTLRWMGLALAVLICVAAAASGGWVLAGGTPLVGAAFGWLGLANEPAVYSADDRARVEIISQPDGAVVFVDGRQKGNTPVVLSVSKAMHRLVLKHPEAVDDQRLVTVSSDMNVSVRMWRRQPDALQLRPTYPGASISDAAFLADGRLALSMALPVQAGGLGGRVLHEEWIFDPNNGSFQPFDAAGAIRASVLVVSPDGRSVAYLRGEQSNAQSGAGSPRLGEVWVAVLGNSGPPVRVFALPSMNDTLAPGSPLAEVEELHDVAWTPDGAHLLVTAQLVSVAGGYPAAPRSRLLLIEAPVENQQSVAPPTELVTLPATVVPGSYTWAPDGHWVAFLTQASGGPGSADFVALCAVDTSRLSWQHCRAVDRFR